MINSTDVPDDSTYIESPVSQISDIYVDLRTNSGNLIKRWIVSRYANITTVILTLTAQEAQAITDWSNLQLWITANSDDTAKFSLGSIATPISGDVIIYFRLQTIYT